MQEGRGLRALVDLVRDHGSFALIAAVEASEAQEFEAELVLATAYKAKGRQWPSVRLTPDFVPTRDGEIDFAEIRLFYVALNRAQHKLVADPRILSAFGVKS